jgi:hypothetical protein
MMDDGIMIDEELLLLLGGNESSNLHIGLPYWKYDRFKVERRRVRS